MNTIRVNQRLSISEQSNHIEAAHPKILRNDFNYAIQDTVAALAATDTSI